MSLIQKQMKRFLVAGISAVSVDLATYYLLLGFLAPAIAKTISFIVGTIVAFIINKHWTFEKHERSYKEVVKFVLLYVSTLFANVTTNEIVLNQFHIVFLGFLVATSVSTVLNFIGQKWWVFR